MVKSLPAPVSSELITNFDKGDAPPVLMMFAERPKLSVASLIACLKSAKVAPAAKVTSNVLAPAVKVNVPPDAVTTSVVAVYELASSCTALLPCANCCTSTSNEPAVAALVVLTAIISPSLGWVIVAALLVKLSMSDRISIASVKAEVSDFI